MPRLSRISLSGYPQHVIQRGNNRQVIFTDEEDIATYANWLKECSKKYGVQIHAWVFMTNHVHLLCTPVESMSISRMMQALGRLYVRYFNVKYQRSGTLWEGRYKSCVVNANEYLFSLYRYIELNPVRAKMVNDPSEYLWSSYQCNGLGKPSELISYHPLYQDLGVSAKERQKNYRGLFSDALGRTMVNNIRSSVNKGVVLGNELFAAQIQELSGRRAMAGKKGRPVGWRKKKK
jgi:putative transposase